MSRKKTDSRVSRRLFLGGAAAAAAGTQACSTFTIIPRRLLGGKPRHIPPSEKLNIGAIGCGGKGESDIQSVRSENIIALCDVDAERAAKSFAAHPEARKYKDYREMLEKETELDAVIVATPDHHHAPASILAMSKGLHVYCQKPLTHTVYEARMMRVAANKYGVTTQMGNQGCAENGFRQSLEILQSGAIGPVKEVHVWTNRPIWPQGIARPTETMAVPSTLDWDLWLGPAPSRPYHKAYAPFAWRGWLDFGTGALGDMACHTANMAFMALKLEHPTTIEAESAPTNNETYPNWSIITYQFPERGPGLPAVKFVWYDGGKLPDPALCYGQKMPNSGLLLIGDKGTFFSPNDYGADHKLFPEKDFAGYKPPEPTIPRSPGHYKEWLEACKSGKRDMPLSNFNYSSLLTETILLGNAAVLSGKKLEWDAKKLKFKNDSDANKYLKMDYRDGYTLAV